MSRKRAIYAAELIKDAMEGCPDVEIRLHFPYELVVDCTEGRIYVGEAWANIPPCSGGGKGKDVIVRGCRVEVS